MKKDKNLEYVQKLRNGGVNNKAMNYINDLRPVKPAAPSVETPSETPDYLCFTATGESTIRLVNRNNYPVLFYSKDKENWTSWDYSTITLNDGESLYLYGDNPNGISKGANSYSNFTMIGSIAVSGNIQTLLSKEGDILTVTEYWYYLMFKDCTYITTAPELPATTLAANCYNSMFEGCTGLTTAPELPATTLADGCYSYMFSDCTKLQSVTTYVTTWNTDNTADWLYNAGTSAENPTIYCPANSNLKNVSDSDSGIPYGWVQVDLTE